MLKLFKEEEIKSICYAIFSSQLSYRAQIWGQSIDKYMNNIYTSKKNALRMSFAEFSGPLIPRYKILKIPPCALLVFLPAALGLAAALSAAYRKPKQYSTTHLLPGETG